MIRELYRRRAFKNLDYLTSKPSSDLSYVIVRAIKFQGISLAF